MPQGESPSSTSELTTLQLIADELGREITEVNQRQANAITRAAIVLAAAGVTLFIPIGDGLGVLELLMNICAAISSIAAIVTISYWKSNVVELNPQLIAQYSSSNPSVLFERIINDRMTELSASINDMNKKALWATISISFLAASWALNLANSLSCSIISK